MKRNTFNWIGRSATVMAVSLLALSSCNKNLTKADVQDEVEDAREATAEAQEETEEAVQAREQFYVDAKETQVNELTDRLDDIDDRIKDLRKTAKKSDNEAAISDMESAIDNLQDEKETINERITEVQAMEPKDWSSSYDEIDQSVARIESEIDKLSQSLENSNN